MSGYALFSAFQGYASPSKYTALAASADGCLKLTYTTKWTLLFELSVNHTCAVAHEMEWDADKQIIL